MNFFVWEMSIKSRLRGPAETVSNLTFRHTQDLCTTIPEARSALWTTVRAQLVHRTGGSRVISRSKHEQLVHSEQLVHGRPAQATGSTPLTNWFTLILSNWSTAYLTNWFTLRFKQLVHSLFDQLVHGEQLVGAVSTR